MPLRASIVATVLSALAVRLVHVWQMRGTVFFNALMGDSRGYDAWGLRIAAGDWIGRDVFYQAPLYPYFLGLYYAVFGHNLLVVRVVQAVIGTMSAAALCVAVARLVSPRAGLIAGLMLAWYPPAIFFDGLIQKSVLDVFFVCVSLAILAGLLTGRQTRWRWVSLGVAMGALALTRENAMVLIAVIIVWSISAAPAGLKTSRSRGKEASHSLLWRPDFPLWRPVFRPAVLFVSGVGIVLLPVAIRNYAVGGEFYLTTSQFGSNLYIGNNPRADGSYMSLREGRGSPEYERVDATELAEQATGRRLSPRDVSSYWTRATVAYIGEHPVDWLRLMGRKAWYLVSSTEIVDTESQESHAEYSLPLRLLGPVWHFGVLLPLAIVGAVALWPERRRLWPIYLLTAAYAASVVLFFVVARYRLPLVPYVMVFGAAGVSALVNTWRRAASETPRVSLTPVLWGSVAVAIVAANWPLHTAASQQAITENNLGTALQETGRIDESIERYQRALSFNPSYTPAMNNLGAALRAAGRVNEALTTYDQAMAARPNDATIVVNKGNALMAQGKIAEAIAAFRDAVRLAPQSTHARSALANALYDQGTVDLQVSAFGRAAENFREAIALTPDYAEAHNNLGIALASQGHLREAIVEWEEALRLNPNLQDARRNLERAGRGR